MGISYDPNTSTYRVIAIGRITTTTVTASGDTVTSWINSVYREYLRRPAQYRFMGVDVKSRPHGLHGDYHIYLLTIVAGTQCLVFQIYYCDSIPSRLRNFLTDEELQFVALGSRRTKLSLQHKYNLSLENVEDMLETVKVRRNLDVETVEDITKALLKMEVQKPGLSTCKWSDNQLSMVEIEYATIDALVPYAACVACY